MNPNVYSEYLVTFVILMKNNDDIIWRMLECLMCEVNIHLQNNDIISMLVCLVCELYIR